MDPEAPLPLHLTDPESAIPSPPSSPPPIAPDVGIAPDDVFIITDNENSMPTPTPEEARTEGAMPYGVPEDFSMIAHGGPEDFSMIADNEHSMPNPEEARTEGAIAHGGSYNRYSGKNKRLSALVAISVAAVALVVGFSIAIVQNHKGSATAASSNGLDPSLVSRLETVQDFLKVHISSSTALANQTSPQYKAALWIADEDEARLDIPADPDNVDSSFTFVQRYVLAVFYYALDGPNWPNQMGFLTSSSVCDWNFKLTATMQAAEMVNYKYGVQCNANMDVSQIFITSNNLIGQLPIEIGDLLALEHLSLFKNNIVGPLPDRMKFLVDLNFLAMESNKLACQLPATINHWTKLQYLALGDNGLTGALPDFSGMDVLEEVALDDNKLNGTIDAFNAATKLRLLYLNKNRFNGRIHDESFPDLSKLETLVLGDNDLTGYFPAHFYNFRQVDISNNSLDYKGLPAVTIQNSPLTFLSLYGNNMPGTIPATLNLLTNMVHLDLSENDLTGPILDVFDDMVNLQQLYLSKNNFDAGSIPELRHCTKLKVISMAETNLNGYIHQWMGSSLTDLILLDLHDNKLTGSIPATIGNLENLESLFLNRNMLQDAIPAELAQLPNIVSLFLDNNSLTGNLQPVCDAKPKDLVFFITDCESEGVTCKCCSDCCVHTDVNCNNSKNLVRLNNDEGIRQHFLFSEDVIFKQAQLSP